MTASRGDGAPQGPAPRTRIEEPRRAIAVPLVLGLICLALLLTLGTWQVERRRWKLDLIAQVERNLRAAPRSAPDRSEWPNISTRDAYRKVVVDGHFDHAAETPVKALTARGPGFWIVTPLVTERGFTVLVNRGFVPIQRVNPSTRTAAQISGPVRIFGLLRLSEPGGAFLRANDPAAGRWYSRDVHAIARARRLKDVAPYFIDADAAPNAGGVPIGGLTVIAFPNSHLVYAITWYGLAVMTAAALIALVRGRSRRGKAR